MRQTRCTRERAIINCLCNCICYREWRRCRLVGCGGLGKAVNYAWFCEMTRERPASICVLFLEFVDAVKSLSCSCISSKRLSILESSDWSLRADAAESSWRSSEDLEIWVSSFADSAPIAGREHQVEFFFKIQASRVQRLISIRGRGRYGGRQQLKKKISCLLMKIKISLIWNHEIISM